MNITQYAGHELKTFEEKEFCEVDSLVLSQFSYLFFDSIVPGEDKLKKGIRIKDIYRAEYFEKIFDLVRLPEENLKLFSALAASPRFRGIKMNYYVNEIDIDIEMQFSAVSFILDRKTAYIAFRGTGARAVGWKEDFNMAFLDEVPAQRRAKEYVDHVARKLRGNIMLGGHSKGGNLAVYSAAMCRSRVQKRITAVFSHDGPGFKSLGDTPQYAAIKERIRKTVPQTAIIGMLLENQKEFTVVKSTRTGIMQHDPFSWEIENGSFVTLDSMTNGAKFLDKSLSGWIATLSDEDRARFVDALFKAASAEEADRIFDFEHIKYKDIKAFIEQTGSMEPDTRKFLLDRIKDLIKLSIKTIRQ